MTKESDCMKKLITWTMSALILMIGFPWLAVTFAGSAGGLHRDFTGVC